MNSESLTSEQLTALAAAAEHFRGRPDGMTLDGDLVAALVADLRQARTDADEARAAVNHNADAYERLQGLFEAADKRADRAESERDAARAEVQSLGAMTDRMLTNFRAEVERLRAALALAEQRPFTVELQEARAEVEQLAVLLAEREDVCTRRGAELAGARARVAEFEAVRDGEVMVEGSWFKRADLSTALADARRALGDLAAVARNETRAMDLWWRTSGDDWAVPNDLPGRFLAAALAASRSSSPATEAVTEPETMPWWRANPPVVGRTAVDVIAWITKAGGEARYEPEWRGWLTHGPRIVITGPDGDVVMAPGDKAVKGNWFVTDGPIGSRQRRDLREFTVVRRPTPEETT